METVLAVVALIAIYSVHRLFARDGADEKSTRTGLVFAAKHALAFLYVKLLRLIGKDRKVEEDIYGEVTNDCVSLGVLPHSREWEYELPRPDHPSSQRSDEIAFHGVNSKGACLVTYLIRRVDDFADVWLYLKLEDGRCYSLLRQPITANYVGTEHCFAAHGLSVRCLSPMRRWRIVFNGLLKTVPAKDPPTVTHVKFQFTWNATSSVYDLFYDTPVDLVASAMAAEKWKSNLPDVEKLKTMLNKYEQCGCLMGTVTVDGKEEELHLWGTRSRSYGTLRTQPSYHHLHLVGMGKTGETVSIGALNVPEVISDFKYGFVTTGNGFLYPIDVSDVSLSRLYLDGLPPTVKVARIRAHKRWWKMNIDGMDAKTSIGTTYFSELQLSSARLNDKQARSVCIFYHKLRPETIRERHVPRFVPRIKDNEEVGAILVTSLQNSTTNQSSILGGKGSSLVDLHQISDIENSFSVPKGIVITFNAYRELIRDEGLLLRISQLEDAAWGKTGEDMKEICSQTVEYLKEYSLPVSLAWVLHEKFIQVFGTEYTSLPFAVRSSAQGEDSEDLSAAGQMETFLNVTGIQEIRKAIMKCWASQFSHIAVQYKRINGQAINTPMAVIIQEMVKADVAGVMFTCDPVTSNPNYLTISANYGLGESVVSGSSEADTITLWRNHENRLSIHSSNVGSKKTKIVSKESGGIEEVNNSEENKLCLNDEQILRLGNIGILIEEYFGSLRDIEWAIRGNDIYLLQTRPITSVDKENDYSVRRELEGPWKSECEYITTANLGEVFPGAVTPLTFSIIIKLFDTSGQRRMKRRGRLEEGAFCPYFLRSMTITNGHMVFNLIDTLYRYNSEKATTFSNSSLVSLFGRILEEDDEFRKRGRERYSTNRSTTYAVYRLAYLFYDIYNSKRLLEKTKAKYADFKVSTTELNSSSEIFEEISKKLYHIEEPVNVHIVCTVSSSIWNSAVLSNLVKAQNGWTTEVYADFAFLTSNINSIESASVPAAIDDLAWLISKHIRTEEFQKMETNKVFSWLNDNTEVRKKFQEFIEKHGHRCIKEFDLYSKTWKMDPLPLIKTLQNSVGKAIKQKEGAMDIELLLNKIKSPLTKGQKRILRFVLPRCRKAVEYREATKSFLIKILNSFREAFYHLGQVMVDEGRLFDKEHLFFLTFEELDMLIKTRSARILHKAVARHKIYYELDSLKFPEIHCGIPNPYRNKAVIENNGNGASVIMKGTPVSQGIVKGKARVILNIKEADSICQGEILITYSTDIGWSPYFPLISGLVTELGGLISHGAVVAREYGLPCIVGVHSASEVFRTGDIVLLDGNSGILQKVTEGEGF